MSTPEQLDAIQARADAATEGPWKTVRHDLSLYVQSKHANLQANLGYVGNRPEPDANFIAHARTDVPALLAYARDLETRIGRVKALADDACAQPGTELVPVKAMGGFIRAALTATDAP